MKDVVGAGISIGVLERCEVLTFLGDGCWTSESDSSELSADDDIFSMCVFHLKDEELTMLQSVSNEI